MPIGSLVAYVSGLCVGYAICYYMKDNQGSDKTKLMMRDYGVYKEDKSKISGLVQTLDSYRHHQLSD